jgi:DNA adenine methylase
MNTAQISLFGETENQASNAIVNVASVPQRSPFRYPGGKTWLIPVVRNWLKNNQIRPEILVEPFAGGGIVSLTAAFENLAPKIIMSEIDPEVAAVWEVILNGGNEWLAEKIYNFDLISENIQTEFSNPTKNLKDLAFCTILKNRVLHGGIITKGAGFIKNGENGKGLASRWYPKTLRDRIRGIDLIKNKIEFFQKDAFQIIEKYKNESGAFFFIDPPYSVAGKRLYTFFEIDHERLFRAVSELNTPFLMTYDDNADIRNLAEKYKIAFQTIPMKTTLHFEKNELLLSNQFDWR